MRLRDYQRFAKKTDQFPGAAKELDGTPDRAHIIPLLGLTGEVGTLLAEYKKLLRDGPVHLRFKDRLAEELGDTLWYISTVATRFGLSLEKIAAANLKKVDARWSSPRRRQPLDQAHDRHERLPLKFAYSFGSGVRDDGDEGVALFDSKGRQLGNLLSDNAHKNDGYRFHDVMHFAFVAILGWSPVARKLLDRKRRSSKKTNLVEDGGRASVIDEAIVAMVFDYVGHDLEATENMRRIDSETLRSIRALTRGFEVHARTEAEWEEAILAGLNVWRQVEAHDGGQVLGDFARRKFTFAKQTSRSARRSDHGEQHARRAKRRGSSSVTNPTSAGRTVAKARAST